MVEFTSINDVDLNFEDRSFFSNNKSCDWNVKPQNGTQTFFSEDSYAKWFGRESHEIRLAENLRKVGVHIQPKELGKLKNTEPNKSTDDCIKKETENSFDKVPVKPHKNPVRLSKLRQQALLTQSTSTESVSEETNDDATTDIQGESSNQDQSIDLIKRNKEVRVEESASISAEKKFEQTIQIPVSARKDSKSHAIKSSHTSIIDSVKTEITQRNISQENAPSKIVGKSAAVVLDGNVPRPEAVPITEAIKPTEEKELKKLRHQNMLYFNRIDRPDKYDPLIFKNKPLHRKSDLTYKELLLYLDLYTKYGHIDPSSPHADKRNAEWTNFQRLSNIVQQEQRRYQGFLKKAAYNRCEADYEYLHPTAEKYIMAKLQGRQRRVSQYPRFYKQLCKFSLPNDAPEDTPTLQYNRPLLELGGVCRLQLPVIVSGCPQPCAPTDYKEVSSVCPPIRGSVQGPHVWHHEECSQDLNAEQLAVPNKCDIVLSACSLKYLIDNQGMAGKCWSMPVTVREYNITEGDKPTTHRVVYLDKPLIRMSQYNPRDKSVMFHKYALKTAALRKKQKMIVFSKICPVADVEQAPEVTQVIKELDKWEKTLKATEKYMVPPSSSESEEELPDGDESKRRFKRRQKNPRKRSRFDMSQSKNENDNSEVRGVGVFDVEKDIEDLETFGMDSFIGFKGVKKVLSQTEGSSKTEFNTRKSLESSRNVSKQEVTVVKERDKINVVKSQVPDKELPTTTKQRSSQSSEEINLSENSAQNISDTDFTDLSIEQDQPVVHSSEENKLQNKQRNYAVNESQIKQDKITKSDTSQGPSVSESKPPTTRKRVVGGLPSDIDTTQALTASGSKSQTTRKSSAKKTHSLSDIMQKMSTVKAKLREREQKKGGSDIQSKDINNKPVSYDNPGKYTLRTRKAAKTAASPVANNKTETADSDSENENDGLVIDLPQSGGESPQKKAKTITRGRTRRSDTAESNDTVEINNGSHHETIGSPPASPVMELCAPESPKMAAPQSPDATDHDGALLNTCVMIPLDESGNESVVRDYSMVKDEHMETLQQSENKPEDIDMESHDTELSDNTSKNMESDIKCLSILTRGSKRKSSGEVKTAEPRTSKRVLRSRVSKDETECSGSTPNEEDSLLSNKDALHLADEATITQIRGGGRKREMNIERVTRSRSVSMDASSNHGNSPARGSSRLTRNSVDSVIAEPELPVKRKRSRLAKKSVEQIQAETIDSNTNVPAAAAEPNTKIAENSDQEDEESDKEITQPRRKGRPPKRLAEETREAQKVKELAKNLQKKIASQKSAEVKDKTKDKSEEHNLTVTRSHHGDRADTTESDVKMNKNKTEKSDKTNKLRSSTVKVVKQIEVVKEMSGDTNIAAVKQPIKTEAVGSLESILNMQTEMLKPTTTPLISNAATTHDKFAGQHGMSHVKFPMEGNVTYHQWSLADTRVVVRCSYHGHAGPQGVVHISTKMEYQPCFGFEQETNNEVARNWMSVYVRPNSSLIRTRINPFNSEIMKLEHVGFKDLVPSYSNFKPLLAFADMNAIFKRLKGLSAGQYLLRNSPSDGKIAILKSSEPEEGNFDLHKHHASFNTGGRKIQTVQWCPIDPKLLLPHHKRNRLLPLLFSLKDGKKPKKKKGGKKKRKQAQANNDDSS